MLAEGLGDGVLVSVEGEVAAEEGVGRFAGAVTIRLAAVVGSVLRFGALLTLLGEVDVDIAAVELAASFGRMGFAGIGSVDELNVTEAMIY